MECEGATGGRDVPYEILLEIIVHLPVKSLIRFRCVSKSWKSLIESADFVSAHLDLNRQDESPSRLLLMYYSLESKKSRYRLYADHCGGGGCFVEQLELEFPFKSYDTYYYVGSCTGLICFSDYLLNYLRIVLWNPSARSHRLVPIPRMLNSDVRFYDVLSFGFNEKCGEYKVLRLIHVYGRNSAIVGQIEAEIYEVKTNLWRQITVIVPYSVPRNSGQAFLDGFIHWIGFSLDAPHLKMVVMSFDFHGETFGEMDLPNGAVKWSSYNPTLVVHRGSLCLIEKDMVSGLCIWIMNEYGVGGSWTKLFAIDLVGDLGRCERVLGFRMKARS